MQGEDPIDNDHDDKSDHDNDDEFDDDDVEHDDDGSGDDDQFVDFVRAGQLLDHYVFVRRDDYDQLARAVNDNYESEWTDLHYHDVLDAARRVVDVHDGAGGGTTPADEVTDAQ